MSKTANGVKVRKGKFIVFEGIDGSSKTTTISSVASRLRDDGMEVIILDSRNADSIIGSSIRQWINDKKEVSNCLQITLQYLSALVGVSVGSSRYPGIDELRKSYDYILMDRWYYSTLVYGTNIVEDTANKMIENAHCRDIILSTAATLTKPDMVFILELDPKIAYERLRIRDGVEDDYFTTIDKQEIYASKFHTLAQEDDITSIDTSRSILEVTSNVMRHIAKGEHHGIH